MKQHLMLIGVAAAAMAVAAEPAAAPVPAASSVSSDVVALPPPPKDTDVVASVGDATLTWGDLQKQAAQDVEAYAKVQQIPPQMREAVMQQARQAQVQHFIESKVVAAAAKKMGVTVSDAQREQAAAMAKMQTGKTLDELFAEAPIGAERTKALFEEGLLMQAVVEAVTKDVKPSEADVTKELERVNAEAALAKASMEGFKKQLDDKSATFEDLVQANSAVKDPMDIPEAQLAMAFPPEAVKAIEALKEGEMTPVLSLPGAQVIFKLNSRKAAEKDGSEEAKKTQLEDIRKRIVEGGEDFAKLAQEFSDCPSGKRAGGDLGEFGRGMMVKEFEDLAFTLPVGEVSPVFKTQFGWHILKVTKRDDAAGKVQASHILLMTQEKPASISVGALVVPVPEATKEQIERKMADLARTAALEAWFVGQLREQQVTSPLFPEFAAPAADAQ